MIRINKLPDGTLFVHSKNGDTYETSIDKLPPDIRERYAMLAASDASTSIYKVGVRRDDYFFIVEDGDLDDQDLQFMVKDLELSIWLDKYIKKEKGPIWDMILRSKNK